MLNVTSEWPFKTQGIEILIEHSKISEIFNLKQNALKVNLHVRLIKYFNALKVSTY